MRIIAVDDERLPLENLMKQILRVEADAELLGFSDSAKALSYLAEHSVDIAFLDIEMAGLSGIALAKHCKELCPTVNIIFVTGHSQYMLDAFNLHASGYLLKPVLEEDLRREMENLRYPLPPASKKRVRVQTFGNFEVFVDGRPLDFPRAKSKECMAYLIDRKGARVSVSELAAVLWEDMPDDSATQNRVHQVIYTLGKALKDVGVQDILIKSRREIAIDTGKVDCDYYAAVSGDMAQMNAFTGEYMKNYSWAEFTLGSLAGGAGK